MKPVYIIITFLLISLTSCYRFETASFKGEILKEYQFENYTGKKQLPNLSSNYDIADSMIQLVTFTSFKNNSNAKLSGVYIGDMRKLTTDTVILYCHGENLHMDHHWNRAKLLANIGGLNHYGVLMFDYRGYGMSEGETTEETLYADTDGALKWLQSLGLTSNRLIIYGFSLGTAPSTQMCFANYSLQPSKLILEAPMSSSEVMVQDATKLAVPSSFYTNAKIDNAEKIKKVKIPFMWIHGTADSYLSIEKHGEIVYQNYKGVYKEAHRIEVAEHEDVPNIWGYDAYLQALNNFVKR